MLKNQTQLFTTQEAATLLVVSASWHNRDRVRFGHIQFIRVGRAVRRDICF